MCDYLFKNPKKLYFPSFYVPAINFGEIRRKKQSSENFARITLSLFEIAFSVYIWYFNTRHFSCSRYRITLPRYKFRFRASSFSRSNNRSIACNARLVKKAIFFSLTVFKILLVFFSFSLKGEKRDINGTTTFDGKAHEGISLLDFTRQTRQIPRLHGVA